MSAIPWILIGVGIIIILFAVIFALLVRKRKKYRGPDYYTFFIMGILWIPIGLAMKNYFLFAFGLVLMIVGLVNRKKWKQNRTSWKEMDKSERKLTIIVIILLALVLVAGLIAFLLFV